MNGDFNEPNRPGKMDDLIVRAKSANDQAAQSIVDNARSLKQSRAFLSGADEMDARRRLVDLCRSVGQEMNLAGDNVTSEQLTRWRDLLMDAGR